ncbi:MAG: hypothetical protein ABL897_02140 [Hyphomicrobium sp.]
MQKFSTPLPTRQPQCDTERRNELARLLPLWPNDIADLSIAGRRRIIAALERALRAERCRGKAGHWAYDLARHAALIRSWRLERVALHDATLADAHRKAKRPPVGERL